jgi:hypothetical protein
MSIQELKKDKSTVIVDPKDLVKPEFQSELERGLITRVGNKTKNKKPVYVNGKGQRVDENGTLLTKRGQPDKRSNPTHSGENLKKRWQQVAEANKNKNVKVSATVDSESDSEPEFEIETISAPAPPVVETPPEPTPSRTELYIKQEEEKRRKYDEEIFKLKEENSKLKTGLVYNDHLNRISHLAKSVKLKF